MKLLEILESIAAAAEIAVLLPVSPFMRSAYNRQGATEAEVNRTYPGDERVPNPVQAYTRAVTLHAPASIVYAYLIQLGQERAGMYSYDLLENLVGCQMHTVDHIVPEWQTIRIGDTVRFGPKGKTYPLLKVVAFEPNRSFVLAAADPKTEVVFEPTDPMPEAYANQVIAYFIDPVSPTECRLICRSRLDYRGGTGMTILWRVTEVLNYVMEQKLFRTIKHCAERDARAPRLQPT